MDNYTITGLPNEEKLREMYQADRLLYALLVVGLTYHPLDAMYIMAFFIWMQRLTCLDLISKLQLLASTESIQDLTDEAIVCLRFFNTQLQPPPAPASSSSELNAIPRIEALTMSRVTLHFLLAAGREFARESIKAILHSVCYPLFRDLMVEALAQNHTTTKMLVFPTTQQSPGPQHSSTTTSSSSNDRQSPPPLVSPSYGSQHLNPVRSNHVSDSTINFAPVNQQHHIQPAESSSTSISRHGLINPVHPDHRTLFVTFSKGHPVGKKELLVLLDSVIGADAIEEVVMKPPKRRDEQVLFATVVVHDPRTIGEILKGEDRVKFHDNRGKHVIIRKFIPKHLSPIAASCRFS